MPTTSQPILILHGTLLDPARNFNAPADLLVADGRIAEIAPPGALNPTRKTPASSTPPTAT